MTTVTAPETPEPAPAPPADRRAARGTGTGVTPKKPKLGPA